MLDFSLCSSHEAQSFAEVRGGLYEVQWECFFFVFFSRVLSQLFLIKDKNMDRDVLQKHVWK